MLEFLLCFLEYLPPLLPHHHHRLHSPSLRPPVCLAIQTPRSERRRRRRSSVWRAAARKGRLFSRLLERPLARSLIPPTYPTKWKRKKLARKDGRTPLRLRSLLTPLFAAIERRGRNGNRKEKEKKGRSTYGCTGFGPESPQVQ